MASRRKMLKEWIRQAEQAGWRVETGGSGHLKWYAPDGETLVVTPTSPGRGRAMQNTAASLRRAGLDVST